jgi:hypothetical protein
MDPSESVKNIVSNIMDISTTDIKLLITLLSREVSYRYIEDKQDIGVTVSDKFTGKEMVNLELLIRKDKKQQRDLRAKLEAENILAVVEENDDPMIVMDPIVMDPIVIDDTYCGSKPEFRKQKKVKPVYKSYRLKSQKRLDKEKRAKRKPANLFA